MLPSAVVRPNISSDAAAAVRRMICSGELAGGKRINEVHMAAALGVSRTPLREALMSLVAEGALEIVPRRGFFVRPLTGEEVRGIYPIRAILDPEALRLSGVPTRGALRELSRIDERIRKTEQVDARIDLDDEWHLRLIANCPNPVLLDLIQQFIRRTRRYEIAYLKEMRYVNTAWRQHRKVMRALRAGDLPGACEELRRNLVVGQTPILNWLERRSE